MNQQRPHQGWIASLSNGETVFEYPTQRGELSAWQALLQRCTNENIRITQMRLQRGGVTIVGIPNADGYIQAYELKISNKTRKQTLYQGIGCVLKNHVFITWLNNQGQIYHDVRPLEDVWVHTDKRKLVDIL